MPEGKDGWELESLALVQTDAAPTCSYQAGQHHQEAITLFCS